MKILCITSVFPGIRKFLRGEGKPEGQPGFYKLVEGLVNRKHEIHIVYSDAKKARFKINPYVNVSTVSAIGVSPYNRLMFLFNVCKIVNYARKLHKEVKFDIIYGTGAPGAVCGSILGKLLCIPNVTRLYGSCILPKWGSNIFKLLALDYREVLAFKMHASYLVITQDGTGAAKLAHLLGVQSTRVRAWFNGVDKNPKRPNVSSVWPIPTDAHTILWVSRLSSWKKPDRALKVFTQLANKISSLHLIFVGDGNLSKELISQAHKAGVDARVHFVGSKPHDIVLGYYTKCDIFLSLFDYSNLSNTVIEAMAAGCCVVALNECDTSLLINNGKTGFLINKDDFNGLISIIVKLINDPSLRLNIGRNAKDYIFNNLLTWEERINQEIDLLESL